MADSKSKPTAMAGFNWAESLKKADQAGTAQKVEAAPSMLGALPKSSPKNAASKKQAGAAKSQMRLRVKV